MTEYCKDYGDDPACQGKADPRYTLDYTDVEPGCYFHFCTNASLSTSPKPSPRRGRRERPSYSTSCRS